MSIARRELCYHIKLYPDSTLIDAPESRKSAASGTNKLKDSSIEKYSACKVKKQYR